MNKKPILKTALVFCLMYGCNSKYFNKENKQIYPFNLEKHQKAPIVLAPNFISLSGYNEYGGNFSPEGDEFYFTRFKPGYPGVIMCSKNINGSWSTPETVSFMAEYPGTESCFLPEGNNLVYVWSDNTSEDFIHDFYIVNKTESKWGLPEILTSVDLGERRISPSISNNLNLYFSGNKDKLYDKDIYVSYYIDKKYKSPINLGEKINSEHYEEHVFIAPDESFILFDSYRPGGEGKSDIYICYKNDRNDWGQAINLGSIVNSKYYDWYPTVSPDGQYLFFARTIDGSIDMYWCSTSIFTDLKIKSLEENGK